MRRYGELEDSLAILVDVMELFGDRLGEAADAAAACIFRAGPPEAVDLILEPTKPGSPSSAGSISIAPAPSPKRTQVVRSS